MAATYYLALALVTTSFLLLLVRLTRSAPAGQGRPPPFPRGPAALPLVGNLHQLTPGKSFLATAAWSRDPCTAAPGGLVGLRLGPGARAVVLSRWAHVRDLLDSPGRGALYADRPQLPVADYVLPAAGGGGGGGGGADLHLVFARYGPRWRRARRTVAEFLCERELVRVAGVQDAESTQMMWEFMRLGGSGDGDGGRGEEEEEDEEGGMGLYHRCVMRCFGAVILASVFGLRGGDSGPRSRVARFFTIQDEWTRMLGGVGTPPLGLFPGLKRVPDFLTPWRGWQKRADSLKERQSGFYHELVSETEERAKVGKGHESFLARIIKDQEAAAVSGRSKDMYTRLELDYIGGFMMEAGADTTAMTFETFLLAMVSHPEIQKQAQEEVDAIFGPGEMPHTCDGNRLPFLKACFLETLRWRPPLPTAIPHANTSDDVYQGHSIPKRTLIIPNVWAIGHDPDEFEDPDAFKPHRYLSDPFGAKTKEVASGNAPGGQSGDKQAGSGYDADDAAEISNSGRRQTYAFGAGRRVCAGSRMAENSLMMAMAKLMWCFDIVSGTGEKPDVDMATAFKASSLTGPRIFPVQFVLRDERKGDVIRQEWAKADAFLSRFE